MPIIGHCKRFLQEVIIFETVSCHPNVMIDPFEPINLRR
jgi:hypothetical protein